MAHICRQTECTEWRCTEQFQPNAISCMCTLDFITNNSISLRCSGNTQRILVRLHLAAADFVLYRVDTRLCFRRRHSWDGVWQSQLRSDLSKAARYAGAGFTSRYRLNSSVRADSLDAQQHTCVCIVFPARHLIVRHIANCVAAQWR